MEPGRRRATADVCLQRHRVRRRDSAYRLFSIRGRAAGGRQRSPCPGMGGRPAPIPPRRKELIPGADHFPRPREQEARQTTELLNRVGRLLAVELDTQARST